MNIVMEFLPKSNILRVSYVIWQSKFPELMFWVTVLKHIGQRMPCFSGGFFDTS